MGDYLLNYWNLFYDFSKSFRDVVYRQIPLPLLANFYKYLSEPLKKRMRRPDFAAGGQTAITRKEDIGPAFDRLLATAMPRNPRKTKGGHVLVHMDYVRLVAHHFQEIFVPGETLLVGRGGPPSLFGHPLLNIRDYAGDVTHAVRILTMRARKSADTAKLPLPSLTLHVTNAFVEDIPRMAEMVESVRRLLDAHPVSCIVVGTTEDLMSRCLVLAAGIRGIPSICLQHGLIMGEEAYLPAFATKTAVYGRLELSWYLNRGVPRERIAVMGHPRYDLLHTRYPAGREEVLAREGLDPRVRTVLVATQPAGGLACWIPFIQRMTKKYGFQVIVKPHPLEIGRGTAKEYARILGDMPRTSVVTSHVELADYLFNVDAVAVRSSTVGLEAMICGKPLFVLRDRQQDRRYEYYEGLGSFVQDDPIRLATLVAYTIGRGRLEGRIGQIRREFLRLAYPLALSGPVLAKQIGQWTGRLPACLQTAFEGQLVKGNRDEVYLIENGKKRHIAGLDVFAGLGCRWEDVCVVDDRILARIPDGPAITDPGKRVVETGMEDRLAGRLNGILVQGGGSAVYLLDRGLKRHIATEQTFARMRFDWMNVCRLDDRILSRIPSGPFIG